MQFANFCCSQDLEAGRDGDGGDTSAGLEAESSEAEVLGAGHSIWAMLMVVGVCFDYD